MIIRGWVPAFAGTTVLKRRRQFLRAGLGAVGIHALIGDGQELRDGVVAAGDQVSGTDCAKATIFFTTTILASSVLRAAPDSVAALACSALTIASPCSANNSTLLVVSNWL